MLLFIQLKLSLPDNIIVTFDHIWPSYVNYISLRRFINQNIVNNKRNIDKAINCKFIQNNHTNKLILININQLMLFILNINHVFSSV